MEVEHCTRGGVDYMMHHYYQTVADADSFDQRLGCDFRDGLLTVGLT